MAVDYTGQGGSGGATPSSAVKYPFVGQGTITIPHNTGKEKVVQVFSDNGDGTHTLIEGDVDQNLNTITISLSPPHSGYVLYF